MPILENLQKTELVYIVVLFALFIVPRYLQRFRLPSAITCLALGIVMALSTTLFDHDRTIALLATFGIVALFLFAGLEINFSDLRPRLLILLQYVAIQVIGLIVIGYAVHVVFGLATRPSMLVALALLTPSAGFILDSIRQLNLDESEATWVRAKVISAEFVALAALFGIVQSATVARFSISLLVLVGLIAILPLLLQLFAKLILPYAPRSEFAFLLMLAVVCSFVTRELGVYYLVGAFVAGIAAQRFRRTLPAMGSEKMLDAIELFASFFVPFYFFNAGLHVSAEDFSKEAILVGLAFSAIIIPIRILWVGYHRQKSLQETLSSGIRIGVAMLPTLVFTLVIAGILRERFEVPSHIFGGLVVYTLINTLIPGFALRIPPPNYEVLHAGELEGGGESAAAVNRTKDNSQ